jgi:hypothetical protein
MGLCAVLERCDKCLRVWTSEEVQQAHHMHDIHTESDGQL